MNPLGKRMSVVRSLEKNELNLEDKVNVLTRQIQDLFILFNEINSIRAKEQRVDMQNNNSLYNKDGLPLGINLYGYSRASGNHVLTVTGDGYCVGDSKFDSLSSAAEAVSGVRRSGWTYWKLQDGRTLKDAFNK